MSWVAVGMMAAGAVMGKMKNDRAKQIESSDRRLASETQRYSPWTGMSAGPIRSAGSEFGDVIGGGMSGLGSAQSMGVGMFGSKKPVGEDSSWYDALASKKYSSIA